MITSPDDLNRLANAFQRSRVLLSAFELGVFTALDRDSRSAAQMADELKVDARALDRLLGALTALGLATKQGDEFTATEFAFDYLSNKGRHYLSSLWHLSNLYSNWATLTDAVRHGGMVLEPEFDTPRRLDHFIEAMHRRAMDSADELVAQLYLSGARRVLDVGGGSGVYSIAMCRANSQVRATVFDLHKVIPLAEQYIQEAGLSERINTMAGDYLEDEYGGGFDLIFCSAIMHINSLDENAAIVRRAFDALNPGGTLAVVDFVMDETRTHPPFGAIFALNMLVNTQHGDVYTEQEIRDWFTSAGLTDVERRETGPLTSMILGRKE